MRWCVESYVGVRFSFIRTPDCLRLVRSAFESLLLHFGILPVAQSFMLVGFERFGLVLGYTSNALHVLVLTAFI
jgi:hypothetical protein